MKSFRALDSKKQNDIRREYKNKCSQEYKYSIHLFILYTILGICSLIGLILIFFAPYTGAIIFITSLIGTGISLYFLSLSNQNFYKFLAKKGYKK